MGKTEDRPPCAERRRLIGWLGAAGLVPLLAGCGGRDEEAAPAAVSVDRARLEREGRVVVKLGGEPVEVKFDGERIEARSLVCTHVGCVVRWDSEQDRYVCPCHEGRFDADGNPVAGPPTTPLRRVALRVTETTVLIGEDDA